MWKTAWRWTWKTVLGVLTLLVVLVVALLLVNIQDEELIPQAAALLKLAEPTVPQADNGYPDLIGLNAPPGEDAHQWGLAWLAAAAKVNDGSSAEAFSEKWKAGTAGGTPK